jgi:hypothetical protein
MRDSARKSERVRGSDEVLACKTDETQLNMAEHGTSGHSGRVKCVEDNKLLFAIAHMAMVQEGMKISMGSRSSQRDLSVPYICNSAREPAPKNRHEKPTPSKCRRPCAPTSQTTPNTICFVLIVPLETRSWISPYCNSKNQARKHTTIKTPLPSLECPPALPASR